MKSSGVRTLGGVLRHHAEANGSALALDFEGRLTDYRSFDLHASQVANGLAAMGLKNGDRVCFLSKNSDSILELVFGCGRGGFIVCGLNWRLLAQEVAYILDDCGARALFVGPEFLETARRAVEMVDHEIALVALEGGHPSWPGFTEWRDAQSGADPVAMVDPEDIAVIMYTSGTTGRPKGVQLPHRCFFLFTSIEPVPDLEWVRWYPHDRNLVAMPCFHVGGLAYAIWAICGGSRQVILREFDAEIVLSTILEKGITRACILAPAVRFCLDHPDAKRSDFSPLKYVQYGGAAIDESTLREAIEVFGCDFAQSYGMTETTGAATYLAPSDHRSLSKKRLTSVGRALPGVEIKVVDRANKPVAAGQVGEICIKSPAGMTGYWNKPDETRATIVDGFVHTGDAGYLDEDGYLYLVDRIKDLIISGGENISSLEVEEALRCHPEVADAAAVGVADRKWGEAVKAFIVRSEGATATAEEIIAFCRNRIAPYKCPKSIEFIDALPRNASGKLLKRQLRERAEAANS